MHFKIIQDYSGFASHAHDTQIFSSTFFLSRAQLLVITNLLRWTDSWVELSASLPYLLCCVEHSVFSKKEKIKTSAAQQTALMPSIDYWVSCWQAVLSCGAVSNLLLKTEKFTPLENFYGSSWSRSASYRGCPSVQRCVSPGIFPINTVSALHCLPASFHHWKTTVLQRISSSARPRFDGGWLF